MMDAVNHKSNVNCMCKQVNGEHGDDSEHWHLQLSEFLNLNMEGELAKSAHSFVMAVALSRVCPNPSLQKCVS